jgi:hypothetical protein
LSYGAVLPRLTAAEGLFLFSIKKKQKMPAENFSFEGSSAARTVQPEKFVRPDLSRTGDTVLWPSWMEMKKWLKY